MPWYWWLVYELGVLWTWAFVYVRLRDARRRRLVAWAIAAGCSIVWPLWLAVYRHQKDRRRKQALARQRQQAQDLANVAALEAELRQLRP